MSELYQAHYVEVECPTGCGAYLRCAVGIESDGDESGVWSYIAAEVEGETGEDGLPVCSNGCALDDDQHDAVREVAKAEYEAPDYPTYPI